MRYLDALIAEDLRRKMVFLSGPRQSGKTHLALSLMREGDTYLTWDDPDHRRVCRRRAWPDDSRLLVFDELHKNPSWRNWLKGTYDTRKDRHAFLVTGSARLDLYRRGGDSLTGRYHHWRLHPFCLSEARAQLGSKESNRDLDLLMELGGFPEPFLAKDSTLAKRWRNERRKTVLREDLRDLERVVEVSKVELLLELLSERVSSPAVALNLSEDLACSPKAIKRWIEVLTKLYLGFLVHPYAGTLARAIRKAPKFYFYDNAEVYVDPGDKAPGARFENLVASHLLKRLQYLEDKTGDSYALQYVRDKEHREVDFVVVRNRKPIALVEAKWADATPARDLNYFGDRLGIARRIQLVRELARGSVRGGISLLPASQWLSAPLDAPVFN